MSWEDAERAAREDNLRDSLAWQTKWPNHCKACRGWGGRIVHNYPHSPDDFEPCEALDARSYLYDDDPTNHISYSICHRCDMPGKPYEGGICEFCRHNDDDGDPGW